MAVGKALFSLVSLAHRKTSKMSVVFIGSVFWENLKTKQTKNRGSYYVTWTGLKPMILLLQLLPSLCWGNAPRLGSTILCLPPMLLPFCFLPENYATAGT